MKFMKGMCVGLMVGACVGMAAATDRKSMKRRCNKAVKAAGQVLEDIGDAIGL